MVAPSTLGQLILGYQFIWNPARQPAALQLFLLPLEGETLDAPHFLRALDQTWTGQSLVPLLTPLDAHLLAELLRHAQADGPWLSVQQELLADDGMRALLQAAHQRGVTLLWRGPAGQRPDPDSAGLFARSIITLTPGETLAGAQAALRQGDDAGRGTLVSHSGGGGNDVGAGNSGGGGGTSGGGAAPRAGAGRKAAGSGVQSGVGPIEAGQIVEAVPSRLLADHCLDQAGAWGVAGWPVDDVLLSHRHQPVAPSHRAIVRLLRETDADVALDLLEHTLAEEPLLAYRFLRYTNSAAVGLRSGVESLRHGLMLLGLKRFKQWLMEQMPQADNEPDMDPVRTAIVMRAHLMEHLLDAGEEDKLRREVFLTGVLSQIDGFLAEPLRDALNRLPLSERVNGAILGASGPYAPFLEIAAALEYPRMHTVPALCEAHELALDDVNRTLLRVLAQVRRVPG